MSSKQRIKFLDCTRALCMLWIIGVWHMADYINISISNNITKNITNGVLVTFTLISGYFMGKNKFDKKRDVINFFKKRLIRIYPLFFLSCTSLYIIYLIWNKGAITSFGQYIYTLFGIASLITPAPKTIWFVSMIILFYTITPIIMCWNKKKNKVLSSIIIMVIFVFLDYAFSIDKRLIMCFPFYCVGMLLNDEIKFSDACNYKLLLFFGIIFFIISSIEFNNTIMNMMISAVFIVFIFEIGKICTKIDLVMKLLNFISYASMSAYLFHRQFLGVVHIIVGNFQIKWAYVVILPITILIAYVIQYIYDLIINRIVIKKEVS